MRLTESKLKKLIKEMLSEGVGDFFYGMYGNKAKGSKSNKQPTSTKTNGMRPIEPKFPSKIDTKYHDKLKSMLQSDNESFINQAFELINTLAPNSSFEKEYREYLLDTQLEKMMDTYHQAAGPDERIPLRKQIYDLVNKRAGELYPNDRNAAYEYAYNKINNAGIMQESIINEGILQQMEAEKILRDEFFRVKELRAQGKATEEELMKAYEDMKNLDKSQFYTDEELASAEAERAERKQGYQDRLDSEDAEERARNARLGQDRIAALKMRGGYKDRGISMGPDDPGDVDDLYPDLREAKLNPTFFQDVTPRQTFADRVLSDPEVDPKIKTMLKRALDNPREDWAHEDIKQVDMLLRSLYPKYAKELDHYDSHQASLEYTKEFDDFYKDAKQRLMKNPDSLMEGLMYEGDNSVLALFEDATLEEGGNACGACLFEQLQEASCGCPDLMGEAEYQGRKVTLNKPMRGDVKKFKVYVKDPKTGNVKKVNFGDPNMKIKKSNPKRRKSFRARHNCDNPGPKTKARYWSCKKW